MILNLRKYLKTRKEEAGCTVVDNKKRNYTKWFTITPTKGNIHHHEDIKINE